MVTERYTAYEITGTVKVGDVDVTRRVYQVNIDYDYIPLDPSAKGMTNRELMRKMT